LPPPRGGGGGGGPRHAVARERTRAPARTGGRE
jgi:hypothetical protein